MKTKTQPISTVRPLTLTSKITNFMKLKVNKQILLIAAFIFMFNYFSFGQGSAYCGPYEVSTPIIWTGINNQTISNLEITNPTGNCIKLTNCSNITIQNCKLGPSKNQGVSLYNCKNITITNCTIDSTENGVYAITCSGMKVIYNDIQNVQGPFPRGEMVQFNDVTGAGNSVSYNCMENFPGQSNPEDAISIFKSHGIAGDPIQVVGNWIRGGGPSKTGGGIMAGDNGGSYILIKDNILVNPGNYGIAIASGTNITIKDNKIYGKQQSISNIGLYIWNQTATECSSDTIMNNRIRFKNSAGENSATWNAKNCGEVFGWTTNIINDASKLDESILPEKIIGRACSANNAINVTTKTVTTANEANYNIYSNSATGHFIVVESKTPKNDKIAIYNLSGQKIIEQFIGGTKTMIDINSMPTGVYIVKISNIEKTIEVKKIVVSK